MLPVDDVVVGADELVKKLVIVEIHEVDVLPFGVVVGADDVVGTVDLTGSVVV